MSANKPDNVTAVYNRMAKSYDKRLQEKNIRYYSITPTIDQYLDQIGIKGKNVLDVGCGTGFFSRRMKHMGASWVVGVDKSPKMIEKASAYELEKPRGIDYLVADAAALPIEHEFDIVTGFYLLHYANSEEKLQKMCQNLADNLKEDGTFLGLTLDPIMPLQPHKEYDFTVTRESGLFEGAQLLVTFYHKGKQTDAPFTEYHWSMDTYDIVLPRAGFRHMLWERPMVSEEAIQDHDPGFWNHYLKQPGLAILKCQKTF